jgi:hypothetical protein
MGSYGPLMAIPLVFLDANILLLKNLLPHSHQPNTGWHPHKCIAVLMPPKGVLNLKGECLLVDSMGR